MALHSNASQHKQFKDREEALQSLRLHCDRKTGLLMKLLWLVVFLPRDEHHGRDTECDEPQDSQEVGAYDACGEV